MNLADIPSLSDEELQIKAAEFDGWDYVGIMPYTRKVFGYPPGYQAKSPEAEKRAEMWPPRLGAQRVPDYPNDVTAALKLALSIGNRYWMELHTPFRKGDPFFVGFTPLGTSGWNGRPDNQCEADKPGKAITRAYILTMESENHERD